jgi:hypothetical protein
MNLFDCLQPGPAREQALAQVVAEARAIMANAITLSHPDELSDLTAEVVTTRAQASARDRRIEKAFADGRDYCSACGRAIKDHSKATRVTFTNTDDVSWLGSECVKKLSRPDTPCWTRSGSSIARRNC